MNSQSQAGVVGWGAARSKEVTWHDPGPTAERGLALGGLDYLRALADGSLPPAPIMRLFGGRLASVAEGEAVFVAEPDDSTYNPIGMVHGGWLSTLLDSAAGCAVHTLLPAGVGYASIELKVSFLKAVRAGAGPVEVRGSVLRLGRSVAFAEAHATNAAGELVGHATSSLAITRPA